MTYREYQIWVEEFNIEPWGEVRADLNAALVTSTLVNCQTGGKANARPADFMPEFGRRHVERSDEELLDLGVKANAMLGGNVRRRVPEGECFGSGI